MSPEDKKKFREAMTAAVNRAGSKVDEAVDPALNLPAGTTVRDILLNSLNHERAYEIVEQNLRLLREHENPGATIDDMIEHLTSDEAIQDAIDLYTNPPSALRESFGKPARQKQAEEKSYEPRKVNKKFNI
jgi:hypothetical protein